MTVARLAIPAAPAARYRLSFPMSHQDLSQLSLEDLYRLEVETHTAALTLGLEALLREPAASDELERCMLAAHSLKGAARIANVAGAVGLADAMESCFAAACQGRLRLDSGLIALLARAVGVIVAVADGPQGRPAADDDQDSIERLIGALRGVLGGDAAAA